MKKAAAPIAMPVGRNSLAGTGTHSQPGTSLKTGDAASAKPHVPEGLNRILVTGPQNP